MLDSFWSCKNYSLYLHSTYGCMDVSKNRGTPRWMVYNGKPPIFLETPIYCPFLHLFDPMETILVAPNLDQNFATLRLKLVQTKGTHYRCRLKTLRLWWHFFIRESEKKRCNVEFFCWLCMLAPSNGWCLNPKALLSGTFFPSIWHPLDGPGI